MSEWTVRLPIKDAGHIAPDDFRLAVAPGAFNLHLRGREDIPLLAGETAHALAPAGCSWRLGDVTAFGTQKLFHIELTLAKATRGLWRADLLRTALI